VDGEDIKRRRHGGVGGIGRATRAEERILSRSDTVRGQIRKIVANQSRIFLTQLILRIKNTKT
jgi:hypothetical protein